MLVRLSHRSAWARGPRHEWGNLEAPFPEDWGAGSRHTWRRCPGPPASCRRPRLLPVRRTGPRRVRTDEIAMSADGAVAQWSEQGTHNHLDVNAVLTGVSAGRCRAAD